MVLLFLLAWAPVVRSQDIRNPAEDLPGSYNRALASLQRGDYDRGLDVVRNVISYWGAKAGSTVGPIFGHFYYLQGLLLMGKEDYDGAIAAFRACHDDFPNTPPDPNEVREIPWMPNRFRVHALAQWGACLVVITRYEEAVQILEKALDESKQPGNKVPPELIGLNLGRAYLRSGAREKGREFLGRALDNPGASHFVKQAAFMILAEDWTPKEKFAVVEPFLWQYADLLREDGFCAGDGTRLLARLDTDRPSRPATREPIVVQTRAAETSPREPMRVMAGPLAGEPPRFVAAGSACGGPAATAPPSGSARAIVRCTRTGRATRDPFLPRNGDRRPCGRPPPRS